MAGHAPVALTASLLVVLAAVSLVSRFWAQGLPLVLVLDGLSVAGILHAGRTRDYA